MNGGLSKLWQKDGTKSVLASLISILIGMAVGGVIILHETLSVREWVGCGIMLLTIFYVQLPHREPVKREPVKAA